MSDPFESLAADTVSVLTRLMSNTLSESSARELLATSYSTLAYNQETLDMVRAVLGRVTGMLVVSGPPDDALGAVGSTAFDPENRIFYGPKTISGWGEGVAFIDQGPAGTISVLPTVVEPITTPPSVVVTGTPGARTLEFHLPDTDFLPVSRTVPTGKNKFRADRVIEGTEIYGDGLLSPQPDSAVSEMIYLADAQAIHIQGVQSHTGDTFPYARWLAPDGVTLVGDVFTLTTGATGRAYARPIGADYVQICPRQRTGGTASYGDLQVEYGTEGTAYEAPSGEAYLTLGDTDIYRPAVAGTFDGDLNLFDPDAVTVGFEVYGDGTLNAQADSVVSAPIDVRERRLLTISGLPTAGPFDHNWRAEGPTGDVVAFGGFPAGAAQGTVVLSDGAVTFRFSPRQRQAGGDYSAVQVVEGPVARQPQTYMPRLVQLNARRIGSRPRQRGDGGQWGILGDSITCERSIVDGAYSEPGYGGAVNFTTHLRNLVRADGWHNYAVSGADWRVQGGQTTFQTIREQIDHMVGLNISLDRLILNAGTNGGVLNLGDVDTAMAVGTLAALDHTNLAQAMRYALWLARETWPDVEIFVGTPLQRADLDPRSWAALYAMQRTMAGLYGAHVVDQTYGCRIVRQFETWGTSGRYLVDGLHTNPSGKVVQANLWHAEIQKVLP